MNVAIVPAKDCADSIAATVDALRRVPAVSRVLVVDDGSADDTTDVARAAGADVLRLPLNVGKGEAVAAAVRAAPDAEIYLLVDADVGATAIEAERLLESVVAGDADMTVGVLPSAGLSTGPRLNAPAKLVPSDASGCRNVTVCKAPQRSGSFLALATAWTNVVRTKRSRAAATDQTASAASSPRAGSGLRCRMGASERP